jgi:hypothetical protein
MTNVPFGVFQWLIDNPWVFWVWVAAGVIAVGIRAAYPKAEERPRLIVFLLAVIDILQTNWSGPIKLLLQKKEPAQ